MKLKPEKTKQPITQLIKETFSVAEQVRPASISVDINGGIFLENFRKLLNYQKDIISIETDSKRVYIYGENLTMSDCNKYSATVFGDINKIEIFSIEVK